MSRKKEGKSSSVVAISQNSSQRVAAAPANSGLAGGSRHELGPVPDNDNNHIKLGLSGASSAVGPRDGLGLVSGDANRHESNQLQMKLTEAPVCTESNQPSSEASYAGHGWLRLDGHGLSAISNNEE